MKVKIKPRKKLKEAVDMLRRYYKKQSALKLVVYGVMFLCCVLFMMVLPLGQDLHFHLYRVGAMAEELERTSFVVPIRILSASYNNYGYGAPLFYGDLLLYIPAVLVTLGMDAVTAYKLLMVGIFLLAFAAAVLYVFSPYFLLVLCVRMAIGEACACIFLPFVFCAFYDMLNDNRRGGDIGRGLHSA